MALPHQRGLTYDDLQGFPDDHLRRELIDGELIVTPAPRVRHQGTVMRMSHHLYVYAQERGGQVYPAPLDVVFTPADVVEPDVLFIRHDHLDRITPRYLAGAPDVVVEVSSPSTRRLELVRKLALYERFGVPEYVYVDLDADRVEVYRLDDGGYRPPALLPRGETYICDQLPGFRLTVDEILGPPDQE